MEMEYLTLDHSAVYIVENNCMDSSGEISDDAISENQPADPDARMHWLI